MRPEFIDPRHLWSAYHYLVVGLAYNKNLVKTSEVPKTYQDLLLARWKGRKMSLERDAGDVFGGVLDSWGEKKGIEYFRRLAKQDVLIRSGYTLQAQLLAAGEVELVPWSHSQRPLLMADSGAPLGIGSWNRYSPRPKCFCWRDDRLMRTPRRFSSTGPFRRRVEHLSASISCAARCESVRSRNI